MTASFAQRRARFRAILEGDRCISPASVFDPMSARCAAEIGYETMMLAGSTAALAVLGAPDLVLITLTEFAGQVRRVTRAADLPLLVDADHGYGNALNAARTVEELEYAGVAALTIEDTALPTPFGSDGQSMISIAEGAAKIRAAVAARTDSSLVVAGRTSALRITGLADTVARIKAYDAAGADALYLVGIKTREELAAVAEATRLPLMIGSPPRDMEDPAFLASQNARIVLQGHKPMQLAIAAVHNAMRRLRDGTHPSELGGELPDELLNGLVGEPRYEAMRKAYLSDPAKRRS